MDRTNNIIYDFIETNKQNQTSREMISFIEKIGATVIGIKPACLFGVHDKDCLAFCRKHFTGDSPVSFIVVRGAKRRKRLFIYHKKSLDLLLSNVDIRCYFGKVRVSQRRHKRGVRETAGKEAAVCAVSARDRSVFRISA